MWKVEDSTVVRRPPGDVWSFVIRPGEVHRMVPGSTRAELEGAGLAVGSRVRVEQGGKMLDYRIVTLDPEHRLALAGQQGSAATAVEWTFEPDPDGTRVSIVAALEIQGAMRFLLKIFGGLLRQGVGQEISRNLSHLRRDVESDR